MSIRIHICNNDADADRVIETEKLRLNDQNISAEKMNIPDILIFDHSANVDKPELINQNKICVVFNN